MQPLLIPGWTLNYEIFFYVIFGLALILPDISRLVVVSTILFGLASVSLLITVPPLTALEFYSFSRILGVCFRDGAGMVLRFYVGGGKLSPATAWASLLLGAAAIAHDWRNIFRGSRPAGWCSGIARRHGRRHDRTSEGAAEHPWSTFLRKRFLFIVSVAPHRRFDCPANLAEIFARPVSGAVTRLSLSVRRVSGRCGRPDLPLYRSAHVAARSAADIPDQFLRRDARSSRGVLSTLLRYSGRQAHAIKRYFEYLR